MNETRYGSPADFQQVSQFYREQFPQSPLLHESEYLEWRMQESLGDGTLASSVLAIEEGKLVAFLGSISDRLWDGVSWHEASWLVNLVVAPEHRGGLTSLRLFQLAMKALPVVLATGAGPHMLRLYKSLGWVQLPVVDTFYLVRRPTGLVRWALNKRSAPAWKMNAARLGWPIDVARKVMIDFRAKNNESTIQIERTDDFGALAEVAEGVGTGNCVRTCRSLEYLQWKFSERPVGETLAWMATRKSDSVPLGYLIAKPMQNTAAKWLEIVDFAAPANDREILDRLFSESRREMGRRNSDFARVRCSQPDHKDFLGSTGWLRKTMPVSDDVFCFSRDQDVMKRVQEGPWHFTSIVSDRVDYGADEYVS